MATQLLAGPILRRTTIHRVCVWLATAQPHTLQLTISDSTGKDLGRSSIDELQQQSVKLGESLYIYLLQACPITAEDYPQDTLLHYRLDAFNTDNSMETIDLQDVTYHPSPSPSFFIPRQLKQLLHGSCRKPHGGFVKDKTDPVPDALSHGDRLLEKTHLVLENRPAILLLTGDQIYADDVPIALMATLRQQAPLLTGKQEMLPLVDDPAQPRLNPASIPLHGRKTILRGNHDVDSQNTEESSSGLSSGQSENHLFSFGEFAAMYLYVFGNRCNWEPAWNWDELLSIGVADREKAEKAYTQQHDALAIFHATLPEIRRLLANIPTYMIFDDHDVTDDWNITQNWYDNVRASPLGRRIISNGLAAYWAFQGWGNDPDNFSKDLVLTLTQQLNTLNIDDEIAERFDLHLWKYRGWGFSIPTDPPVIALDSRTQRQYENKFYPAMLMDRYALDWLRVEWAKLKTGQSISEQTVPIFIAATPVIGIPFLEWTWQLVLGLTRLVEEKKTIQFVETLLDKKGFITNLEVNQLDMESWGANREGLVNFLDTLCQRMELRRCIFLSGDVHYSFTAQGQFQHQGHSLQCFQLTSSAICNEPDAKQIRLLEKIAKLESKKIQHWNWSLFAKNRWDLDAKLLRTQINHECVTAACNLGLVEFNAGLPVRHRLLIGMDKELIFDLSS